MSNFLTREYFFFYVKASRLCHFRDTGRLIFFDIIVKFLNIVILVEKLYAFIAIFCEHLKA